MNNKNLPQTLVMNEGVQGGRSERLLCASQLVKEIGHAGKM